MAESVSLTRDQLATAHGPVRLSVPPDPHLSRVARLAASGLASLAGCTVDEIEDIKIAVSEVLIALIEHGEGARVDLEFAVAGPPRTGVPDAAPHPADDVTTAVFVVRGSSAVSTFDLHHPDLTLCRTVLDGVCASSEIGLVDGAVHITAVVARTEMS